MMIRAATEDDAPACASIYRPYVTDTAITFESEPPTAGRMAERIAVATRGHAWLVATDAGRVVGYAYGSEYKSRAAYRWSCEVSVYLERGRRRTGAGRALYEALFDRLAERGYRTLLAGITLPNPPSEALHRALGFVPVGTFRHIGWKHDAWRDVLWTQRALPGPDPTSAPQHEVGEPEHSSIGRQVHPLPAVDPLPDLPGSRIAGVVQ